MNGEPGFALHPLAAQDITEIWEYIAADNPLAAGRVREDIHKTIRNHNLGLQVLLPSKWMLSLMAVKRILRFTSSSTM